MEGIQGLYKKTVKDEQNSTLRKKQTKRKLENFRK